MNCAQLLAKLWADAWAALSALTDKNIVGAVCRIPLLARFGICLASSLGGAATVGYVEDEFLLSSWSFWVSSAVADVFAWVPFFVLIFLPFAAELVELAAIGVIDKALKMIDADPDLAAARDLLWETIEGIEDSTPSPWEVDVSEEARAHAEDMAERR